jgi:hypothetical protein
MLKMARSIRTHHYLTTNNIDNNSEYEKQIYKKNLNWNPPLAPLTIEDKMTEFKKAIQPNSKRKNCQTSIPFKQMFYGNCVKTTASS